MGPGAAIAAAREEMGPGPLLFLPGDVPWMETLALQRFVAYAEGSRAAVAAPCWTSGETEHLIQWHRGRETLLHLPWRTPPTISPRRASEFLRAASRTLMVPIPMLTDRPRSFAHVTRPDDLRRPPLRAGFERRMGTIQEVAGATKGSYRRAHRARRAGRWDDCASAFRAEANGYTIAGFPLLALHARDDARAALEQVPAPGPGNG